MAQPNRLFIKVHNGFPEHPKTAELSDKAFRHLIELWCFCSRNLNDGKLTETQLSKHLSKKTRQELVATGFIDETPDGPRMHDYLDHQQSAQQVADLHERRAQAGSKGGRAKANRVASANRVAKQTPSKSVADTDTDTDTDELASASSPGAEVVEVVTGEIVPDVPSAQDLVGEWIDHCAARPPGSVIGQVAKHIKTMLDEGIEVERVRAGLAEWNRKGVHPSVLPSVVHEVSNKRPSAGRPTSRNSEFQAQQERAMARAIERERQMGIR